MDPNKVLAQAIKEIVVNGRHLSDETTEELAAILEGKGGKSSGTDSGLKDRVDQMEKDFDKDYEDLEKRVSALEEQDKPAATKATGARKS